MGMKEGLGDFLKGAARMLPGIGSYQDKESIRESDKRLRESLNLQLSEHVKTMERLTASLARDEGSLLFIKEFDDLARKMDTISRRLTFSSRGYAPVFDSNRMDEDALQRLFEFDKSLKANIDLVAPLIVEISGKAKEADHGLFKKLYETLLAIERQIDEREHLLNR
jgi:hypothetical protein